MEIICDESGYEGDKLIDTTTDVFAHSSIRITDAEAASCMRELRDRIRSPATQYKSNHILRDKHREVLRWLLGPQSPLQGKASVYLIDKEFFVRRRFPGALPHGKAALIAANEELRAIARQRPSDPDAALDPLIPAIVAAVQYWDDGTQPVTVVHDRQKTLAPERIELIRQLLNGRLGSLTFADSGMDIRVQITDVIGGAVRKVATDELNGHGDPSLTRLLGAFVNPASVWADARSWAEISRQR